MTKHRALIVGVSDYPSPIAKLPAVAADVREIGTLLISEHGSFLDEEVTVLTDADVTRENTSAALARIFADAEENDTVFVYFAGHGSVPNDRFYFLPYDAGHDLASTGIALTEMKGGFDNCASHRAFLWLDFCHSGGIIPRSSLASVEDERQLIARTLQVVQGQGKLIFAACTPEQVAYEDKTIGHGVFTHALLRGLRGDAMANGEVTANSLYDFIDRKIGSNIQRPMMFGQMTGRLVLMDYSRGTEVPASPSTPGAGVDSVVDSSGCWAFLNGTFFETENVKEEGDGTLTLTIEAESADDEAAIRRLRPGQYGRPEPIPFAYRNSGGLRCVVEVQAETNGEQQIWTIRLAPEDIDYDGGIMQVNHQTKDRLYSPDDFAKMRAGRILVNEPPPPLDDDQRSVDQKVESALIELSIRGAHSPVKAERCVPPVVFTSFGDQPHRFLQLARLLSVYFLIATGAVEQILELRFGPIRENSVHIRFRGRRARRASNLEPAIIELEGDCPLL